MIISLKCWSHFVFDKDQSMRVATYSPEFATERTAVRITKFIISAAYGIPILSKTATNGLFVSPASSQGIKATRTKIAKTKKNIVRHIIFLIERGKVFAGSSLSPLCDSDKLCTLEGIIDCNHC